MNERPNEDLPEDEVELLLPFYVNGTLGEADRQAVESWLAENADASAHLLRANEELELTRMDSDALGMPSRQVLDTLMSKVGAQPARAEGMGIVQRIWDMLSPRYAFAGAAALCAVIALQAGYIVYAGQNAPAQYQTATGETTAFSGPTALVAFSGEVEMTRIADTLTELGLTIVDGPKPGGIFVVGAPEGDEGRAALVRLGAIDGLTRFFQLRD